MWGAALGMPYASFQQAFPLLAQLFPLPQSSPGLVPGEIRFDTVYGPPADCQSAYLAAVLQARAMQAQDQANRDAANVVCVPANTESLARYQAALDNEWYKAMRAFREARQHRLRTLESD